MRAIITQRQINDKYGIPCDMLESLYVNYFQEIGIDVYPISNFVNLNIHFLDGVDLLILTGGGDVPQNYYDKEYEVTPQAKRDALEAFLLQEAINRNIKVLGICRGMQFINGFLGGKISKLDKLSIKRKIGENHKVIYEDKELIVNNFHNDGIYKNNLATSLKVLAEDKENNVIEAYFGKNILGLQWHPERFGDNNLEKEQTKEIINRFLQGEI